MLILYYLGYFYYKSGDIFAAMEKLKECINLNTKSSKEKETREFLINIWEFNMRPTWWRWWCFSPLNFWLKRIIFGILISSIFLLMVFHPFTHEWDFFLVSILVFFLISPGIKMMKMGGFETELHPPSQLKPTLSPSRMEKEIEQKTEVYSPGNPQVERDL